MLPSGASIAAPLGNGIGDRVGLIDGVFVGSAVRAAGADGVAEAGTKGLGAELALGGGEADCGDEHAAITMVRRSERISHTS